MEMGETIKEEGRRIILWDKLMRIWVAVRRL